VHRTLSKKDPSTTASCVNRNNNIAGVEIACNSQVGSDVYFKLQAEKRLARFLALIQYCSSTGKTLEEAIAVMQSYLPGYISKDEFNKKTFLEMCKMHSDVAAAWGYGTYGDLINTTMIKNKAFELALAATDLGAIQTYNELYEISPTDSVDTGTTINFNLTTEKS